MGTPFRTGPLPEYPGRGRAIIEPSAIRAGGIRLPSRAVLCFFGDVVRRMAEEGVARHVHSLRSEIGEHPVYVLGKGARAVALMQPGLGGPLAAGCFEELIALGVRAAVACGGAGVLHKTTEPGAVIVPVRALRDEGTSHHYQPRGRTNRPSAGAVAAIREACRKHDTHFAEGMTWTTDAFYRETPAKIAARRREGCITVEMEAAALFAVARFRKVQFGQILYAGDDVSGRNWDHRSWHSHASAREEVLMLAMEAVRAIP
jgi:uridine phosphorylase